MMVNALGDMGSVKFITNSHAKAGNFLYRFYQLKPILTRTKSQMEALDDNYLWKLLMLFIAMYHANVSLSICCRDCCMNSLMQVDMPIQMASWRGPSITLFLMTIVCGNHFPWEVDFL
jgi:hypothetical protein